MPRALVCRAGRRRFRRRERIMSNEVLTDVPDLLAVRMQILEFVRAREEGTGDVHRLDVHTFERRLDLLLDELVRLALLDFVREATAKAMTDDIETRVRQMAENLERWTAFLESEQQKQLKIDETWTTLEIPPEPATKLINSLKTAAAKLRRIARS